MDLQPPRERRVPAQRQEALDQHGDAFDAGWKCNQKNVRLLGAWLDHPHRAQRGNRVFVALLVLALAALVAVCFAGVYWLFTAL